eukprot:scaffold2627_cov127-Isochrysis_galbana.AAC.1
MVVAVSSPSMVTLTTGAIVRTRYERAATASGYRNNGAERAGNLRAKFSRCQGDTPSQPQDY